MKTDLDMHLTSTMEPGKFTVKHSAARVLGLSLLMMLVPVPGSASVLSELAATLEPGNFVELEIDGSVTTCDAMVPPLPRKVDENGNLVFDEDGNPVYIRRPGAFGNILEFTDKALWDSIDKEVYIMGTRRPYQTEDQAFVKYSEATNSWIIMDKPPFGFGPHGYDHGAMDVMGRNYYWSQVDTARKVWTMDMDTAVWRSLPDAPVNAGQFTAMDYFPELDRLVFFNGLGESEYALYNSTSDLWEGPFSLADTPFGSISHFSEYSPVHGVMFFGGGFHYTNGGKLPDPTPDINEQRRFYMLDEEQTAHRLADPPTFLGQFGSGPVQTIDPNTGNLVVFQGKPNEGSTASCPAPGPLPIWEYDFSGNTWAQTGTQTFTSLWCAMDTVAVPLYEYGVNFIVSVRSDTNCRVYLYRHSSGAVVPLDITVQPAPVTVEQGQTATFGVMAVGRGPFNYQWRKNGINITGATTASYRFNARDMADNNATFDVVVSNATESVISSAAALRITVDTLAPAMQLVLAVNNTLVSIGFSESVSTSSAEDPANYQIDPGIGVTSASLSDDGLTVGLTVSPALTEGITYTISVSNVKDLAQRPNTIVAQSSETFMYRTADSFDGVNGAAGWTPLTASRWSVVMDEGDMAYYLNTTDFSNLPVGRLGEYSLLSANFGDFTFTAQARLGDNVANSTHSDYVVVFGFQDENNYYFAMFNNDQNSTQLFRVVEGSREALTTAANTDWLTDNAYHSIAITRKGSSIRVNFDGNLIMSVTDDTFGAGKVGVGSYNDSAYFDDIRVVSDSGSDTVAPVINLNGNNPHTITVGEAYIEPGATATDLVDGMTNLGTSDIDVSAVDTSKVGIYTVTYNTSDAAGNMAITVTRTVEVRVATDNDSDNSTNDNDGGGGSYGPPGLLVLCTLLLAFRRRNGAGVFPGMILFTKSVH